MQMWTLTQLLIPCAIGMIKKKLLHGSSLFLNLHVACKDDTFQWSVCHCCVCHFAAPVENGDTEMNTEEMWDQKGAEPNEEEPGGGSSGDRGQAVTAKSEETAPEMVEEEEEVPVPKVQPAQPDAPKKEHVNVVFIGHVGQ